MANRFAFINRVCTHASGSSPLRAYATPMHPYLCLTINVCHYGQPSHNPTLPIMPFIAHKYGRKGTAPRPHHHPRGALRSPCPLPSSTLQTHRYVSRSVLRWRSGTARHFFSPPCFHSYHPPFKKKWRALPSSSSVASPLAVAASSSGWGAGYTLCSRSWPPPAGLLCVGLWGCFAPHPRRRGIRLDYIFFLMLRIRLSH